MNMVFNTIRGVLAIGCTIMLAQAASAQSLGKTDSARSKSIVDQIASLGKLAGQEREALLRDNSENLRQIQTSLLNQLGSTDNEVRCCAAYLLGEYRFPRAAVSLSQAITLEAQIRANGREWFWNRYPAVEALMKIGSPAIPAMIQNLEESDDATVRDLSLKVIYSIERDKEITTLRLHRALDTQKDSQKQVRLQFALKSLSETKP